MSESIFKNYIICASNLDDKVKEELEKTVKQFGGIFFQNLTKKTTVLISNKINTEKCLVAQKLDIPVISLDWVKACKKEKKLLKYEDYFLKCFEGIKISLVGFEKKEEAGIIKTIEHNNGIVITGNLLDSDVIVVKHCNILSLSQSEMNLMTTKFENKMVIEDWITESIQMKKFESFDKFKFTHEMFKTKFNKLEALYLNMETALTENCKKKNEIILALKNALLLFSDMIFHISSEFDKQTKDILMKAISLGRGIVVNRVTPLTTHIICNSTKDNFSNRSMSFGVFYKPFVVNPNWVIDSLDKKEILPPENYRPISSIENLLSESNHQVRNEIVINSIVISKIFKTQTFFIYSDSYSLEEYAQIKEKIVQHSGEVIEINSIESQSYIKPRYIIINDGFAPDEMSNLIERKINNYQFIMSHRFIDLCIEKRTLIDITEFKFIHVIPFQYHVPFEDFKAQSVTAFLVGFSINEHPVMENLLETIGGHYELSDQTTHIIVKENIDTKKINYYRKKYNQNIIFLTVDWLLECIIEGKVAKEEKFIIENSIANSFNNMSLNNDNKKTKEDDESNIPIVENNLVNSNSMLVDDIGIGLVPPIN